MKFFKPFLICFLLFSLLLSFPAAAIVEPSEDFYVADYAEVLSGSAKNKIISANDTLYPLCGAQLVVVTVDYLDGLYCDEYAVQLFENWGIGSSETNNGLLLLLAVEENKAFIVQGSGISSELTDKKLSTYLDKYFWDSFDSGKYDAAVFDTFGKLVEWYEDYYNIQNGTITQEPETHFLQNIFSFITGRINTTLVIVIVIILIIVLNSDRKKYKRYYSYIHAPMPRYRFGSFFSGPHKNWRAPPPVNNRPYFGSSRRSSTSSTFRGSSSRSTSGKIYSSGGFSAPRTGGGGRSSGGGAGRSGGSSFFRSSGNSGSSSFRSSAGSSFRSSSSGSSFRSGGGRSSGGGAGRR